MKAFLDIMFTMIEGCSLLYLVKNEKIKRSRQILFLLFFFFIFYGLKQIFLLSEIWIKLLFSYSVPILLGIFVLGLSVKKAVFYMMSGMFLLFISEMIAVNIGLMFQISPGLKEDASIPRIHIIISKIIYATLLVIIQRIISDVNMKRFDVKVLFFFILSNIGYVIVGICIYADIISMKGDSNVLLICLSAMMITFVANVFFSNKYSKIEIQVQEQRKAIYELEIQTRYDGEKMEEEERIKEIYHDMKNHLLLLEESGERNGVRIENLRKEMAHYEDYYRTGNKFVDIILKDKLAKAVEDSIIVEDNLELVDVDFIEPLDFSTIFGNLLDNAIEACKLIKEPKKRWIHILAKQERDFLVICIKNSKINGNTRHVPKKVIHGYGLLNVTAAIHKYGGEIDIMETKYEFTVNIVIPIKKEEVFIMV